MPGDVHRCDPLQRKEENIATDLGSETIQAEDVGVSVAEVAELHMLPCDPGRDVRNEASVGEDVDAVVIERLSHQPMHSRIFSGDVVLQDSWHRGGEANGIDDVEAAGALLVAERDDAEGPGGGVELLSQGSNVLDEILEMDEPGEGSLAELGEEHSLVALHVPHGFPLKARHHRDEGDRKIIEGHGVTVFAHEEPSQRASQVESQRARHRVPGLRVEEPKHALVAQLSGYGPYDLLLELHPPRAEEAQNRPHTGAHDETGSEPELLQEAEGTEMNVAAAAAPPESQDERLGPELLAEVRGVQATFEGAFDFGEALFEGLSEALGVPSEAPEVDRAELGKVLSPRPEAIAKGRELWSHGERATLGVEHPEPGKVQAPPEDVFESRLEASRGLRRGPDQGRLGRVEGVHLAEAFGEVGPNVREGKGESQERPKLEPVRDGGNNRRAPALWPTLPASTWPPRCDHGMVPSLAMSAQGPTRPTGDEAAGSPRARLRSALDDSGVIEVARAMSQSGDRSLASMLGLGLALARACGDEEVADQLEAELDGYDATGEVPEVRRARGYASAFPVRALDLGLLDPEEIFTANNEKFSQITLSIGQPVAELEQALAQIRQGGVLALKVPASEVSSEAADTADGTEVFIYILPQEIQKIVDGARALALESLVSRVVEAAAD